MLGDRNAIESQNVDFSLTNNMAFCSGVIHGTGKKTGMNELNDQISRADISFAVWSHKSHFQSWTLKICSFLTLSKIYLISIYELLLVILLVTGN